MSARRNLNSVFSACGALAVFAATSAFADPTWWSKPDLVPQYAAQTGKGVVMYFESPKARDCIRMNGETWARIQPKDADKNFIWMRLNLQEHDSFFKHYEIFQTPVIIVLNSLLQERFRIQGFVEDWVLMARLEEVERAAPTVGTTTDGGAVAPGQMSRAAAHRKQIEEQRPFFYESFDDFKSLNEIASPLFQPVTPGESRIDPQSGIYGSTCLIVDSGQSPTASIRIDVSHQLDQVEQIEGRMGVTVKMKAITLDEEVMNVGVLTIVPKGGNEASPGAKRYFLTLANSHAQWFERKASSDSFNFKTQKAFLTFQVAFPGMSYCIDDVRVDLLPATGVPVAAAQTPMAIDPSKALAAPVENPLFRAFDKDGDGKILRKDVKGAAETANFERLDINKDGVLTIAEVERRLR